MKEASGSAEDLSKSTKPQVGGEGGPKRRGRLKRDRDSYTGGCVPKKLERKEKKGRQYHIWGRNVRQTAMKKKQLGKSGGRHLRHMTGPVEKKKVKVNTGGRKKDRRWERVSGETSEEKKRGRVEGLSQACGGWGYP